MGLYVTELYLNIPLEIKQVNSLPVTAIQGQNIPCLYRGKKCKCAVNMKKKIKLSGDPATVCSFEKQHSVPGGEATGNSSQQGELGWHQKHLQGPGIPHNSKFQFPQPGKRCPVCFHSLGMCSCEPGVLGARVSSHSWLESPPQHLTGLLGTGESPGGPRTGQLR